MPSPIWSSRYSKYTTGFEDTEAQAWSQPGIQSAPMSMGMGVRDEDGTREADYRSLMHPLTVDQAGTFDLKVGSRESNVDYEVEYDYQNASEEGPLDETLREVLVHELQPSDSLAGLAIRYGVPIAEIRKANKLWSSDSVHIRKTLYIPFANQKQGDEGSTANHIATIRRIPAKELAFFPPGKMISLQSKHLQSNGIPRPSTSQPNLLSQMFKTLPSKDALLSRISFDSRESEISDEHELQELTSSRSSRDSNEWDVEESQTPKLSRTRSSSRAALSMDSESHCSSMPAENKYPSLRREGSYRPTSFDVFQFDQMRTIQTQQPRPLPEMSPVRILNNKRNGEDFD